MDRTAYTNNADIRVLLAFFFQFLAKPKPQSPYGNQCFRIIRLLFPRVSKSAHLPKKCLVRPPVYARHAHGIPATLSPLCHGSVTWLVKPEPPKSDHSSQVSWTGGMEYMRWRCGSWYATYAPHGSQPWRNWGQELIPFFFFLDWNQAPESDRNSNGTLLSRCSPMLPIIKEKAKNCPKNGSPKGENRPGRWQMRKGSTEYLPFWDVLMHLINHFRTLQSETQLNSSSSSTVGFGIDTESVCSYRCYHRNPGPNIAMLRTRNSRSTLKQLTDIGNLLCNYVCGSGPCSLFNPAALSLPAIFFIKLPASTTSIELAENKGPLGIWRYSQGPPRSAQVQLMSLF